MHDQSGFARRYLLHGDLAICAHRWLSIQQGKRKQFVFPRKEFFTVMENAFAEKLAEIFNPLDIGISFLPGLSLRNDLMYAIQKANPYGYPVVSLDAIAVVPEAVDYFLGVNRLFGYNKYKGEFVMFGHGPRWKAEYDESVEEQVKGIANDEQWLRKRKRRRIILVDDFVWTGKTSFAVIELFAKYKIVVDKFVVTAVGRELQPEFDMEDLDTVTIMEKNKQNIYESVSMRDFMVGFPNSGMGAGDKSQETDDLDLIGMEDVFGEEYLRKKGLRIPPGVAGNNFFPSAPLRENYSFPFITGFGSPVRWASIPIERALEFSLFCLEQNIRFFEEVEKATSSISREYQVFIKDLPRTPFLFRYRHGRVVDELNFVRNALVEIREKF